MATHRFILSAGHRNEDRGGAKSEINWTYPSCLAIKDAIEQRGGRAWIIQEEDGDTDPTFCHGRGLQNAAWLCTELAKTVGGVDAYISSHYNGGASPGFHAIFPDARSGVDVKGNNSLDVTLCRTIRDKVKATNTVKMLAWTRDSPGVMSEQETGVGAQGYRLGEFVGTLPFRDTTARVITEASSIDVASEAKYITDPVWVRDVYAEAIVDALESVFGVFRAEAPTPPKPKPQPLLPYPPGMDAKIAGALFGKVTGDDGRTYQFDERGPVSQLWFTEGSKGAAFPALGRVIVTDAGKYFVFSSGLVIFDPAGQGAVTVLGRAA